MNLLGLIHGSFELLVQLVYLIGEIDKAMVSFSMDRNRSLHVVGRSGKPIFEGKKRTYIPFLSVRKYE